MRSSRQIEQDIERTRNEMDETLEQFRERMKPRHLLDEALGMFQSSMGSNGDGNGHGAGHALAHGAKDAAQHVGEALLHTVKRHPLPSLLLAAGAAWLIYEHQTESHWPDWDHMGENSPQPRRKRHRSSRRSQSYDGGEGRGYYRDEMRQAYRDEARQTYRDEDFPEEGSLYYGGPVESRQRRPTPLAAWHEDYDWTDEDERAWSEQAISAVAEMETTLSDENSPARERMRTVASKLKNLSGQKYQSHWREWKERSGSVVDARTGMPYDDSYGCELDYLIESQNQEESEGFAKRAEQTVAAMRGALSKGGRSVRRRLSDLASSMGDYANAARGGTGRAFRGAGHAMQRAGSSAMGAGRQAGQSVAEGTRYAAHSVAEGGRWVGHEAAEAARMTRRGARYAGKQVRRGAVATTQTVGEAIEEHPLAAAAAFLGLGLLAGMLVPETRQEDRLMGETSDRMKRKAYEAGKDAAHRAGHVAKETVRAASEEAERQGIAPSQLAQQASETVSRMAHDVKDQASSEASTLASKVEQVAKTAAQSAKSEIKEDARQSKAAHLADDLKG